MTMPNFLIIGAAKAGTTALYHYLEEHPQIYMSSQKEPRFFALEGETINFNGPNALTKFSYVTDIDTYYNLFKNVTDELAIGEASTWYLYLPKAAARIKHYIPDVKIIIMLRDPVERAYSNFCGLRREGMELLNNFAQAMAAEQERISNNWSPTWHYKQKGFYYDQVKRYFDLFDPQQIKIYLYDDLKANSLGVVQDIYKFLGVDDTFAADTSQKHNVSGIPRNQSLHQFLQQSNPLRGFLHSLVPAKLRRQIKTNLINLNLRKNSPLSPELRKQFIEEYRENILKTQELINRDLSQWLKI